MPPPDGKFAQKVHVCYTLMVLQWLEVHGQIPEITSIKQTEGVNNGQKDSVNRMPLIRNIEMPNKKSDAHTRTRYRRIT